MRRAGLLLVLVMLTTAGVLRGFERGNRLFRAGKYADAVAEYQAALRDGQDTPVLRYNLGTALLHLGRYDEATEHLEAALDADDPELRQWAQYNLGQRYLEDARSQADPQAAAALYDAALAAYRQALRLQPDDMDAKWNYELALQEREEMEQSAGAPRDEDGDGEGEREPQADESGSSGPEDRERPPRPEPGETPLTPEQAERILSAVEQDERELFRDRLREGQPARTVRDW